MYNFKAPLIGIRGSGDLATGVAHRLFKAGFPVIMTELANPRMVRRSVSMGEAVWEGLVCVEGVTAKLLSQPLTQQELQGILERQYVGVVVDPEAKSFEQLRIKFEVDARMLKKELPDQRRPDHFIIGLGPGFVAGENIDRVVETMRGITLGQVITKGSPIANTGVPGVVGGESLRRLLKAPKSGLFKACAKLGDLVRAGDTVAYVDDEPVKVLIDGKLRGLIRTGTLVKEREKVGDCDPRGESVDIYTISDKARAIGGGVLEAVVSQIWRQLAISN